MGRRHSIAGKKAAGDAAKSKTYAKIGKLIEMAARKGGADANMNPALEMILQKARYNSLPREVIDKAIKKGAGDTGGQDLSEIMYEGYGPSGSAMYIKAITSNTNRSSADIRSTLAKMGGSIAEPGAVAWQFSEKGVILIDGILHIETKNGKEIREVQPYIVEKLEEDLLSLDIEDFQEEGGICRVITSREVFVHVRKAVDELGYNISDADIKYLAQNEIDLSDENYTSFEKIVQALEELDDVDSVYTNVG